jgi:hypothetical protein
MNRVAILTPCIRQMVKTTCLTDKSLVAEHTEATLIAFIRRQEEDFNGFKDIHTGMSILTSLFPYMSMETKKLLSRGLWAPITRLQ